MMNIKTTPFGGLYVVETSPVGDQRGKFARFFCQQELDSIYRGKVIQQVNYSLTVRKGTVRGMHFQHPPKAETKMVRCIRGRVFDVAVDLRKGEKTFLHWYGLELSAENMNMLYIPEGFAHGFQALEDHCEMLYLHTESYSPSHEGGIRHDDPRVGIRWPLEISDLSDRDSGHPLLKTDYQGLVL